MQGSDLLPEKLFVIGPWRSLTGCTLSMNYFTAVVRNVSVICYKTSETLVYFRCLVSWALFLVIL